MKKALACIQQEYEFPKESENDAQSPFSMIRAPASGTMINRKSSNVSNYSMRPQLKEFNSFVMSNPFQQNYDVFQP